MDQVHIIRHSWSTSVLLCIMLFSEIHMVVAMFAYHMFPSQVLNPCVATCLSMSSLVSNLDVAAWHCLHAIAQSSRTTIAQV